MAVFFVHEPGRGIVTPLDKRFRIRDIPPTSELEEINRIHPKIQSDLPPNSDQRQGSGTQQTTLNQDEAREAYTQTQAQSALRLGRVSQYMSRSVITIGQQASLSDAWELMERHGIRHLVIVDAMAQLCGMLSEKKILTYLMQTPEQTVDNIPMDAFCEPQVLSTGVETDMVDLAQAMMERDLDGIPVTDQGKLVGIVTRSDVMKVILKSTPFDAQA